MILKTDELKCDSYLASLLVIYRFISKYIGCLVDFGTFYDFQGKTIRLIHAQSCIDSKYGVLVIKTEF